MKLKTLFSFSKSSSSVKEAVPAQEWGPDDVYKWVKEQKLKQYKSEFKGLSGQALLKLQQSDVTKIISSEKDQRTFLTALKSLQEMNKIVEPEDVRPDVETRKKADNIVHETADQKIAKQETAPSTDDMGADQDLLSSRKAVDQLSAAAEEMMSPKATQITEEPAGAEESSEAEADEVVIPSLEMSAEPELTQPEEEAALEDPLAIEEAVFQTFKLFCSSGGKQPCEELDGTRCSKLFRDAGILDHGIGSVEVDIHFAKAKKEQGARKIGFECFLTLLQNVSSQKKIPYEELMRRIATCTGPAMHGTTVAESVRLHDDKSTYTGVYANGGPATVEPPRDLASMVGSRMGSSMKIPPRAPGPVTPPTGTLRQSRTGLNATPTTSTPSSRRGTSEVVQL